MTKRFDPIVIALAVGACAPPSSNADQHGDARFCFASSSDDPDRPEALREDERTGLALVDDANATEPPAWFTDCARGASENEEFVDDTGEHVWIALDAYFDANDLLPVGILAGGDGGSVRFEQSLVWVGGGGSIVIVGGDGSSVVALQYRGSGEMSPIIEGLSVSPGAATSLPVADDCGSQTPTALKFTVGDDELSAANGELAEIAIDDNEGHATNIHTVVVDSPNCTDSHQGLVSTWVFTGWGY